MLARKNAKLVAQKRQIEEQEREKEKAKIA